MSRRYGFRSWLHAAVAVAAPLSSLDHLQFNPSYRPFSFLPALAYEPTRGCWGQLVGDREEHLLRLAEALLGHGAFALGLALVLVASRPHRASPVERTQTLAATLSLVLSTLCLLPTSYAWMQALLLFRER